MEITEVRIKLIDNLQDRLRGFCSITFDDAFVVRDLKIIEGNNGPFVAMPSRKLTANCHKCRTKNHLRANYCNQCGTKTKNDRIEHDSGGRAKLYADVAHPVNAKCREMIQKRVVEELQKEIELSQMPGYSSRYDDDYFDEDPGPELDSDVDRAAESPREAKDKIAEPGAGAENPEVSGTSESRQNLANGEKQRIDPPSQGPQSPHSREDEFSDANKSGEDDFGKGIFE